MWGILLKAGLLALKHPVVTATIMDMVSRGKSTDALIDTASAGAKLIGPENTKKLGQGALFVGQEVSESWQSMAGKILGRATEGVRSKFNLSSATTPAGQPSQGPDAPASDKGLDGLKDKFSLSALGEGAGGLGMILGGLKMRSPLLMLMGIFLSLMMVGQLFGKDDEKKAAPATVPAPTPAAP
ncbi:MAG: hypothetical protein HYU57_08115 [Micavibrio aeruginosavorus]|nr:hypothetical protein [Micavibrio aeruginosavorus]